MTFAQALARIEELLKEPEGLEYVETKHLLSEHADSIVQLWKVAEGMRGSIALDDTFHACSLKDEYDMVEACETYDKLMKEGEG